MRTHVLHSVASAQRQRSRVVTGSWTSHPRAGVDLAGMSDMGGVKHFNVAVDTPEGDVELLKKVMQGANKEVDEGAEERKGGADKIGKCFYSAGLEWVSLHQHNSSLARVCHPAAGTLASKWPPILQDGPATEYSASSFSAHGRMNRLTKVTGHTSLMFMHRY